MSTTSYTAPVPGPLWQLSQQAKEARRPLPPADLVDARQDTVHDERGDGRPAMTPSRDPRQPTRDAAEHARSSDPITSHQAAREMVESGALAAQAQETLEALREYIDTWGAPPTAAELAGKDGPERIRNNRRLADLADRYRVVRRLAPRKCRILGSNCTTWEPV